MKTRLGRDLFRGIAIACVLALAVAVGLWWAVSGGSGKKITAYFTEAVGLYPGSDVRMLGVAVGTVDAVTPQPGQVKVVMSVDHGVTVPADSPAVIVLPSLVSDRYIQLERYNGGPTMSNNTVIPVSRTQPPAEVDDLYSSLNKLASSLGPNGANAHGALSNLLNTGAANLKGNGQAIHDTVTKLGAAARTLNGNQKDLFNTVGNLAKFTTALQSSDAQVRDFAKRVDDVSGFLASERGDLSASVHELGDALAKVKTFVQGSHSALKSNVDNLTGVTKVLVDQRAALAQTLDLAPLGLDNLYNAYNASSGTLDARMNLNELNNPPLVMVCKLIKQVTPSQVPDVLSSACAKLAPILKGVVSLPSVANIIASLQQGKLPQIPADQANPIFNSMQSGTQGGGQ
ncbi:MAG: MCE family protein [Sciscionella sp.]